MILLRQKTSARWSGPRAQQRELTCNRQAYPKTHPRVASPSAALARGLDSQAYQRAFSLARFLRMFLLFAGLLVLLPLGGCLAPADTNRDLVLATWNLEHLAAEDGAGCRPRSAADYRALGELAAQLDATVTAVQEVEDSRALARVFKPRTHDLVISRRTDGQHRRACRGHQSQQLTEQRTGFAIHRERLAALGLDYKRQSDLTDLGVDGRRHGVWVTLVQSPGGAAVLQLLSLHLKSGCAWGALEEGDSGTHKPVRRGQCLTLRRQRSILEEWIDTRVARGEAFVVLGDFNRQLDQPGDHFWADIADGEICRWQPDAELGRRCVPGSAQAAPAARLVLANAGKPFPFPYNKKYPYAVDHLVLDATAGSWIRPDSYRAFDFPDNRAPLSDHHPIALRLRLPDSP